MGCTLLWTFWQGNGGNAGGRGGDLKGRGSKGRMLGCPVEGRIKKKICGKCPPGWISFNFWIKGWSVYTQLDTNAGDKIEK